MGMVLWIRSFHVTMVILKKRCLEHSATIRGNTHNVDDKFLAMNVAGAVRRITSIQCSTRTMLILSATVKLHRSPLMMLGVASRTLLVLP